jgi:hypothetical protein
MIWVLAFFAGLVAITAMLQIYLRDSARDHRAAAIVWEKFYSHTNKLLEGNYPSNVRELAIGLSATTGCGCYVRSLLIEHYSPSTHRRRVRQAKASHGRTKSILDGLDASQRRELDRVIAHAITFDMLSNPLQGWVLKRAMAKRFASAKHPLPVPAPSRAEKEAVIRTVSRKSAPELCAA